MKVKICGITNLEDALAAAKVGADAVGFNFYASSPRYIQPSEARNIIRELPETVMSVGVFVNEEEPEYVVRVAEMLGLAAVQLHGDESPEYCRAVQGHFVIKALRVDKDFDPQCVKAYETEAVLLDAHVGNARGGTGQVIDWKIAREVREIVPRLFLAGGLSAANVAEAISAVTPYAVDACSKLESAPGKKEVERMREFVAAVRLAC